MDGRNSLRKCIRLLSGGKLRAMMSCARTGPNKDLGFLRTVLYHRLPARRLTVLPSFYYPKQTWWEVSISSRQCQLCADTGMAR
ncbi:MAG: hypothetical protein JWQ49_5794 [Edaphobacter sp.]|nr:hypothetical protein [Edaphobacter sp.]